MNLYQFADTRMFSKSSPTQDVKIIAKRSMNTRLVKIPSEVLNSFLRDSARWESDLQADVSVLAIANEDRASRSFTLLVHSKEFAAVRHGGFVPFVDAMFKRKPPQEKIAKPPR